LKNKTCQREKIQIRLVKFSAEMTLVDSEQKNVACHLPVTIKRKNFTEKIRHIIAHPGRPRFEELQFSARAFEKGPIMNTKKKGTRAAGRPNDIAESRGLCRQLILIPRIGPHLPPTSATTRSQIALNRKRMPRFDCGDKHRNCSQKSASSAAQAVC
jgi:hypothetical protein